MNNRICFVTLMNLSAVPYLSKYTENINCKYDVIYWNRYGLEEECGAENIYRLDYKIARKCGKIKKLIGYIRFMDFATRILKEHSYGFVVLLSGNVAVLLKSILLRKYKRQYIIDIRDYFKENNKYYYKNEQKIIENSKLAVISSEAYKNFLPKFDYVVVHNSPKISNEELADFLEKRKMFCSKRMEDRIILSFIGGVRFYKQDKKILKYFKNDERFLIRYIGAGADLLRDYCKKENIVNTYFHDRFPAVRTLDYYVETDFVINLYGHGTPLLDYALSNKLYYCASLYIPILVCPSTYMEEIANQYNLGIAIDLEDARCKDSIIRYYKNICMDEFRANCTDFMKKVNNDNLIFEREIKNALGICQ